MCESDDRQWFTSQAALLFRSETTTFFPTLLLIFYIISLYFSLFSFLFLPVVRLELIYSKRPGWD